MTQELIVRIQLPESQARALIANADVRSDDSALLALNTIHNAIETQVSSAAIDAARKSTEKTLRLWRARDPSLVRIPLYGQCIGGECADHCGYTGRYGLYAYAQERPNGKGSAKVHGAICECPSGDARYGHIMFTDGTYGEGLLYINSNGSFSIT